MWEYGQIVPHLMRLMELCNSVSHKEVLTQSETGRYTDAKSFHMNQMILFKPHNKVCNKTIIMQGAKCLHNFIGRAFEKIIKKLIVINKVRQNMFKKNFKVNPPPPTTTTINC